MAKPSAMVPMNVDTQARAEEAALAEYPQLKRLVVDRITGRHAEVVAVLGSWWLVDLTQLAVEGVG